MTVEPRYPIGFLAAALGIELGRAGAGCSGARGPGEGGAHVAAAGDRDVDRHDNRADEGAAVVDEWLRSIVGEAAG